jgi:uncharacterized protein (DUF2141 family)
MILVLICLFVITSPDVASQNKVTASITNFRNDKGVCRACIFSSEETFDKSTPLQCQVLTISQKKTEVVFDVPNGSYAIFAFHDANNNSKMDKNFLGIPSEGYGASRNKLPFAAKPKFVSNKFPVKGVPVTLTIRLRNL